MLYTLQENHHHMNGNLAHHRLSVDGDPDGPIPARGAEVLISTSDVNKKTSKQFNVDR